LRFTQDHVLFSWRLLVIDLVLMVYLLALFGILLRLGVDITRNVVENAMLKCVVNEVETHLCRSYEGIPDSADYPDE
jgi:hypothetical protein